MKEAKEMQTLQEISAASPVEIITDNGEAIIVLLFSVINFKSSNFNLMNAAFDCIITITNACVEHSIPSLSAPQPATTMYQQIWRS